MTQTQDSKFYRRKVCAVDAFVISLSTPNQNYRVISKQKFMKYVKGKFLNYRGHEVKQMR